MAPYRAPLGGILHRKPGSKSLFQNTPLLLSLVANVILLLLWYSAASSQKSRPFSFQGGSPNTHTMTGNCYCSDVDKYCMCNPSLAIDLVIVLDDTQEFLLVRRKDTNQLATMGGFVDIGETVEQAVFRELKEETGITIDDDAQQQPMLFGMYSDPARDNRRHTASAVFGVHITSDADALRNVAAASDVKEVVRIPWRNVNDHDYFADHKTILNDYLKFAQEEESNAQLSSREFQRSLCSTLETTTP